jgi:Fur family transcriptional regulator, ferric uptake regulator
MTTSNYKTALSVAIKNLFEKEQYPQDYNAIVKQMQDQGINFNKSTLYRQLTKLETAGHIHSITTSRGQYWEKEGLNQHAHFECNSCHNVQCIELPNASILNNLSVKIDAINLNGLCTECI